MERHELDTRTTSPRPGRPTHSSQIPTRSDIANLVSPPPLDQPLPASTQQPSSMSINSLVQPGTHPHFGNEFSVPMWIGAGRPLGPSDMFPGLPHGSPDDAVLYSSPASSRSPSSDENHFQLPHPPSVMEQFPEPFYPPLTGSPIPLETAFPDWGHLETSAPQSQMLPLSLEGDILQSVAPIPIPLSNLDGDEWFTLRRELTSAPGVISGVDGMEIIDTSKWQDCFECYWQHFHPLFPIVHRPTFFATKPSPLMAGAMVAIGSQYDTRPNAKEYSLALLEACLKLLSKRTPITSRSRVSDIQAVFLLEILSKYRSRRADVTISHKFRSLYGSFAQDRHWVSQSPLAVFNSLGDRKPDSLRKAHKFWVEHETRRRVLQATSILDIQQSIMFEQPSVLLQSAAGVAKSGLRKSEMTDLPFPCGTDLWESWQMQEWYDRAKAYEPLTLSSATERAIRARAGSDPVPDFV
jgi:hypothetical protein